MLSIERLLQRLHLSLLARSLHKGLELVAKGYKTRLVLLVDSDITQHQRGVDGIVEKRHLEEGLLHHAAFVDDREHLL